MRILDRYLIRETIGPFCLALGLFTFLLAVTPMLPVATGLLSKGVSIPMVGFLLMLLLPQSLAVTIPMAFLAGLLMALGRLSGDRESVALLACGVSPLRLLRPIAMMALVIAGADFYVLMEGVPNANMKWLEVTYSLLAEKTATDIKPRIFYEGFPGRVLFYEDARPDGTWGNVLLADTSQPGRPAVALAESGRMVLDPVRRRVQVILQNAAGYVPGTDEGIYDTERSAERSFSVGAEEFFSAGTASRGISSMTIAELTEQIAVKRKVGLSPHNEIMAINLKFSFPAAAFVFGVLALGLGLHTRREGKLAGLTLGLGVIMVYYGFLESSEAMAKGHQIPAWLARWVPNFALVILGVAGLWWRMRATGQTLSLPLPTWFTRRPAAKPEARTDLVVAPRRQPARPVLVIRIPRFDVPRPRLLDLYVSGRYLRMAALAFVGLMALYYIGTVIDLSEKVFKGQATGGAMAQYLWYSTPQFIYYVMPLAALVSVLGTIGALTRSSELTVMRACGVSLYRVAAPLLLLALVWSGALFLLQDRVLGPANQRAQSLADEIRNRARVQNTPIRNWRAAEDGRLFYYTGFNGHELTGLTIFEPTHHPFRLARQTFASRAVFDHGAWRASRGWSQQFPSLDRSVRDSFNARTLAMPSPEDFGAADVQPDVMTFGQLRAYIEKQSASGFSIAGQQVELYSRLSYPLVTVVMTILGIPFAVTTGRRGALYGIGLAMVLAVSYWLLTAVFVAAGKATLLPAPLAAAAPNVLFSAIAGYLVLTVRT